MLRTNREPLVIDKMHGVNNAIVEVRLPKEFVPWSHGGYYNTKGNFVRLQGKRTVSRDTTVPGRVLTIRQVDFRDSRYVLWHSSSGYFVDTDVANLVTSTTTAPSVLDVVIPC